MAAIDPGTDAELIELRGLGYTASGTPAACVMNSVDTMGLDPATEPFGLPLYFRSAEDAETFVRSWGRLVAGVVADADLACGWG